MIYEVLLARLPQFRLDPAASADVPLRPRGGRRLAASALGRLKHGDAPRPQPRLDADNRAFWTGGADGELRLLRCRDCATFIHPPRPVCRHCLSENVAPQVVAGHRRRSTRSRSTIRNGTRRSKCPSVIARVAIDGAPGVFLTTNIVGCPVDAVDIGDRVRVNFEQQGEIYFPLFEKVDVMAAQRSLYHRRRPVARSASS